MRRKRICLVTISPETEYTRRIMTGVFSQCKKYGYDVVVVSALVSICNYYKNYLHGELNIYNLINFELFDGFIITPIPMTEDRNMILYDRLLEQFKKCSKPVISLDMEFADYPVVYTDDKTSFMRITEHLIKKHKCRKFHVLSGPDKDSPLTALRLAGIRQVLEENKIKLDPDHIMPGDYWYLGGERLANRYISGELELPDAVICLSDHMAHGLINRLKKNNINVPGDLIVTGFGAVREAAINTPPLTSYVPRNAKAAVEAVNKLRAIIDPAATIYEYEERPGELLKIGSSCGCEEDFTYTRAHYYERFGPKYNYDDSSIWNNINMTMLLESYMTETLTAAENPEDCLNKIYESKYLLKPYKRFYLCLNSNWLNTEEDIKDGYTDTMLLSILAEDQGHGVFNHVFIGEGRERPFPKDQMLPALSGNLTEDITDDFIEPQVFYFTPVHFGNVSLGYAVLQNDLSEPKYLGEVFRNYLRNINNALEMTRAKYRSVYLAEHDAMTGLQNRRSLQNYIAQKILSAPDDASIFAIVIDMDGLKKLNDTYGHSEGDKGIMVNAKAARSITESGEICIRGGGDEFIILGVGGYTDSQLREKVARFRGYIETANETMSIPVEASIGYSLQPLDKREDFQVVLAKADEKMYEDKRSKK